MTISVDALAQEIRRVDGRHDLGAGALAEALLPFIAARLREPADAQAQGGGEVVAWFPTNGRGEIIRTYGDGSPVYACKTKEEAEQAKRCHLGATGPVIPLYTAPPSAPVGMERKELIRAARSLRKAERAIGRALAQQPAAVDDAMVERAAGELRDLHREFGDGADLPEKIAREIAEAVLVAALVAQPGGSDNDH